MKHWCLVFSAWCLVVHAAHASESFVPRVHFESNHYDIPASEASLLMQNAEWLQKNPHAVFILEGHCDEWGEDWYNMQLGDLRAREIKAFLMEQGVDPERIIMVVSRGETMPIDTRPIAEAYRANRRVEFVMR